MDIERVKGAQNGWTFHPPVNKNIVTRQFTQTFDIAAGGASLVRFSNVIVNGVSPIGIKSVWLGAGNLCLGCFMTEENGDAIVYVVNPIGGSATGLTASLILTYYE